MNKRKVIIKPVLELRNAEKAKAIDDWVNNVPQQINKENEVSRQQKSATLFTDYRFTVVIPEFLHRRIKKYCAVHGITIKEKLIEIFEKEFPET